MKKLLRNFGLYFEEGFAGGCLLLQAAFVFINVFSRLFFKHSFPGLDELSYVLFAYVIFIGSSCLYKRYGHGVIDLIVRLFPKVLQAIISVGICILLLGTNVLVTYLSWGYCVKSWTRRTQTLHLPYSITSFAMVLGFALMTIHSIFHLISVVKYKDYFHERPIYKGIFVVDSVEDMVADTEAQQSEKLEASK